MAGILRGDIFWAELEPTVGNEQAGVRPVLIVSTDIFNSRSGTVIAFAITSQEPRVPFPLTVALSNRDLPKRSWVKVGQVRTLATERLGHKIGKASQEDVELVLEGLNEILGD